MSDADDVPNLKAERKKARHFQAKHEKKQREYFEERKYERAMASAAAATTSSGPGSSGSGSDTSCDESTSWIKLSKKQREQLRAEKKAAKKKALIEADEAAMSTPKKQRLRTSEELYNYMKWDAKCQESRASIFLGYIDRFAGLMECSFDQFPSSEIPYHRVQYVRIGQALVWDRQARRDVLTAWINADPATASALTAAAAPLMAQVPQYEPPRLPDPTRGMPRQYPSGRFDDDYDSDDD